MIIDVDTKYEYSIKEVVDKMINLAKKTNTLVRTTYRGVKVIVNEGSDANKAIKDFNDKRVAIVNHNKENLNKLTLEEVLKKMGGLKWPCHHPKLVGDGYYRAIKYKVWRGLFKGSRNASFYLTRIFTEYSMDGML